MHSLLCLTCQDSALRLNHRDERMFIGRYGEPAQRLNDVAQASKLSRHEIQFGLKSAKSEGVAGPQIKR